MGWDDGNVYYSPGKFGLEIVYAADNGGSYEFDMFIVWRDTAGDLYYATDSGCSCPTPFDWASGLDSLTRATANEIIEAMDAEWGSATPQDVCDLTDALLGD